MLADVSFVERLLGYVHTQKIALNIHRLCACRYALSPILIICILIIPWLWSRRRRSVAVAYATFTNFMSLKLFWIFFVYPPVSREVLWAFRCDNLGLDGNYLYKDYRVDCESNDYTWIRIAGIVFTILWPIGALLYFGGLMMVYKVPEIAKKKLERANRRAYLRFIMFRCTMFIHVHAEPLFRFIIANARRHNTTLQSAVTEDCILEDLPTDCLRDVVCAANSVAIGKPLAV
jgi:hypothetical protein